MKLKDIIIESSSINIKPLQGIHFNIENSLSIVIENHCKTQRKLYLTKLHNGSIIDGDDVDILVGQGKTIEESLTHLESLLTKIDPNKLVRVKAVGMNTHQLLIRGNKC